MKTVMLAMALLMVAGCGQKGPLYLPDEGGEVVTRPGGQTASQSPASESSSQSPSSESTRQPSTGTPPDTTTKPDQKSKPKS